MTTNSIVLLLEGLNTVADYEEISISKTFIETTLYSTIIRDYKRLLQNEILLVTIRFLWTTRDRLLEKIKDCTSITIRLLETISDYYIDYYM